MATDATSRMALASPFWWMLCLLPVVLLAGVPFFKPISLNWGDKRVAIRVQSLGPDDPFAEEGVFIRRGWDGGTGTFRRGDLFGVKLGRCWLRLDIIEDPIAAAQRRLPKTLAGLIETLESQDDWLRLCAFQALADMGAAAQPALPELVGAIERGRTQGQMALSIVSRAVGANAVPTLTDSLATTNATLRATLAEILGEIGPAAKSAVPSLEGLLYDPEPLVVSQSALALWKITRRDVESAN